MRKPPENRHIQTPIYRPPHKPPEQAKCHKKPYIQSPHIGNLAEKTPNIQTPDPNTPTKKTTTHTQTHPHAAPTDTSTQHTRHTRGIPQQADLYPDRRQDDIEHTRTHRTHRPNTL